MRDRLGVELHPLSLVVWSERYRWDEGERTVRHTWGRVARAVARAEAPGARRTWERRFAWLLEDFRFVPGGRILAGAHPRAPGSLFNCFVMGPLHPSVDGLVTPLREGALTMRLGGGVGYDFSPVPPREVADIPPGPGRELASHPALQDVLGLWNAACDTFGRVGARGGAMMGTLECTHPGLPEFIEAKLSPGALPHFNLSVLVTDRFMEAVSRNRRWTLRYRPPETRPPGGAEEPAPGSLRRQVRARDLWQKILEAAWEGAEPGVLFVDRINAENNLRYRERIRATNPCGEIPLPPYGACNLGSINLTRFVLEPFTPGARVDFAGLRETTRVAVRFLDDVIDTSLFPLPAQAEQARGTRRIGLGITGLADALVMLGVRYGSARGRRVAERIMRTICHEAYRSSVALAYERGPFPYFERDAYLSSPFIERLPRSLRERIGRHGTRNSHLLAIAPAGSISLLANAVSSGIEPIYAPVHERTLRRSGGRLETFQVASYALRLWQRMHAGRGATARKGRHPVPGRDPSVPPAMESIAVLTETEHILMQGVLQPLVDNAISKTVNFPGDASFERFADAYRLAWSLGLKGLTVYRPNPLRGEVLESHCTTACPVSE